MDLSNVYILSVLISLALVYALLSILTSILIEWYEHRKKSRGKMLRNAISSLLKDPLNQDYGKLVYNHYLIHSMVNPETGRPPQYISSSIFADALIDVISAQAWPGIPLVRKKAKDGSMVLAPEDKKAEPADPFDAMSRFKKAVKEGMNESAFRDTLIAFIAGSNGSHAELKKRIEQWYNDYMERVSGWYKTRNARLAKIFGFVVAIGLNVDSIYLFQTFMQNPELTMRTVQIAEQVADDYSALADSQRSNLVLLNDLVARRVQEAATSDSPGMDTAMLSALQGYYRQYGQYLDSIEKIKAEEALKVINTYQKLQVPVGWGTDLAPVSWFVSGKGCRLTSDYSPESGQSSLQYRNDQATVGSVFLYLLGLCITGFSLSFGSSFWFDALLKLVNVRRSGSKPSESKK